MKELLSSYAFWFVVISIIVDYFVIFHDDKIRSSIREWRYKRSEKSRTKDHTTLIISNTSYIAPGVELFNPRSGDRFVAVRNISEYKTEFKKV